MRLLLTIAITAMATFSLNAADSPGTDLSGIWKGSMNTQGGETAIIITIRPGAVVGGRIQAGEYEAPIQNARVAGDRISFEMSIGPGTVTYDGTVSGDEMKFDVTGTQGDRYTLICKRQSVR